MVDLIIEKDRAKTVDKLPSSALSWYRAALEGRKTFKGEHLSFEATGSNLEKWKERFPNSKIIDESSLSVFEEVGATNERPEFVFKREPMPHQQHAFDKLRDKNAYAVFGDVGSGKSLILTTLACDAYSAGRIDAVLLISINGVVMQQWHDSALPRDVPYEYKSWVWAKTKAAEKEYEELKKYDGLQFVSMNIDALNTKRGYELCTDYIRHHNGRVAMIVDESQTIKTPKSERTKKTVEIGGLCEIRAIATGTPISKGITDLWQQFRFLDDRIIGIGYKTTFEREYCELKTFPFLPHPVPVGPKSQAALDKLYSKIDPYTFRITKEELGFRDFHDEFEFDLNATERKHYTELKKQFMTQLDNGEFVSVTNAISSLVRMQQVSCGFLPLEDGTYQDIGTSRLDALDAYLAGVSDDKVVIWARFKRDCDRLIKHFGKNAVDLSGNVSATERTANKERFIADPNIRFVVGSPKAAGVGVDGIQQVCNRAIFYSNSEQALDFWQAMARTSRIGGEMNAFYCHLIGRKTLDAKIANNLRQKKELSRMTLDDLRELFS
jgi:SNF2 family DNA or RNA helicase